MLQIFSVPYSHSWPSYFSWFSIILTLVCRHSGLLCGNNFHAPVLANHSAPPPTGLRSGSPGAPNLKSELSLHGFSFSPAVGERQDVSVQLVTCHWLEACKEPVVKPTWRCASGDSTDTHHCAAACISEQQGEAQALLQTISMVLRAPLRHHVSNFSVVFVIYPRPSSLGGFLPPRREQTLHHLFGIPTFRTCCVSRHSAVRDSNFFKHHSSLTETSLKYRSSIAKASLRHHSSIIQASGHPCLYSTHPHQHHLVFAGPIYQPNSP